MYIHLTLISIEKKKHLDKYRRSKYRIEYTGKIIDIVNIDSILDKSMKKYLYKHFYEKKREEKERQKLNWINKKDNFRV